MNEKPTKGYMVVASGTRGWYDLGINLINSIKDFDPEAKVCFVTEKIFCNGEESVADYLIYCGDFIREKLTALSKSPFDITMYIDADCEVQHEDITTAFDMLGNYDLMFTPLVEDRARYFKDSKWKDGRLEINGGVFIYDTRKPIVKDFMEDWDHYYRLQRQKMWWPDMKDGKPDYSHYPQHLEQWDQFTLWWLINKNPKYKNIKLKFFDEEIRWNWYTYYDEEIDNYTGKPRIIFHCSGTTIKNRY